MKNKNLNPEIHRQALTAEEAAFVTRISENDFVKRFVASKKIKPVCYDDKHGEFLYDKDDVIAIVKTSKLDLPDWFLEKLKKGISVKAIKKQQNAAA